MSLDYFLLNATRCVSNVEPLDQCCFPGVFTISLLHSSTGDMDGNLSFWMTDSPLAQVTVEQAHSKQIRALAWHPVGHMLASGSRDQSTRFWVPARPGTTLDQAAQLLTDPEHEASSVYSFGRFGYNNARKPWEQQSTPQTTLHAASSASAANPRNLAPGVSDFGNAGPGRWKSGGGNDSRGRSGPGNRPGQDGGRRLPPGYVCKICNIPGHHITECSQYKQPRVRACCEIR